MGQSPGRAPAAFVLLGSGRANPGQTGLGQAGPGLLGPWQPVDSDDLAGLSFDAEQELRTAGGSPASGTPTDVTIWRSDLPDRPGQALAGLQYAQQRFESDGRALAAGEERLNRLAQRPSGGLSFAVGETSVDLQAPESEALALLSYAVLLDRPQASGQMLSFAPGQAWDSVSFGPLDQVSEKWNQAVGRFNEFIHRLEQVVAHYAWVETRNQGQLWARTSVSWTGDMQTAWYVQPLDGQAELHERTLKLVLDSRAALLHTFAVVASGALKLAALLATPAGPLLALPAALNFIKQVHAELTN
jgi:hypothetical protein